MTDIKWPEDNDHATADQMIRHSAGRAVLFAEAGRLWLHRGTGMGGSDQGKQADRRWIEYTESEIADAGLAFVLNAIQIHDPKFADEVARELYERVEDGEWLHEGNADILEQKGIPWEEAQEPAAKAAANRYNAESVIHDRLYDIQACLAKTLDNIQGGDFAWTGAEAVEFIQDALKMTLPPESPDAEPTE